MDFAERLAALRSARGLSVRALADRVFYSHTHVHDVERGKKAPTPQLADALDSALDAEGSLTALARPAPAPDRADRLDYAAMHPRAVDAATVDALAASLASYRRVEDSLGARAVVEPTRAVLELLEALAREARGPVRASVVGLLSETLQYVGWLSVPQGDYQTARAFFDRATVAGMEASDSDRTATALSFAAYSALCRDDPASADGLAAAARRTDGKNAGLKTYLAYQHAEIYARQGDRSGALAQLAEADRLTDRLPDASALPASAYWYTPSFFAGSRAFVLAHLGEMDSAREAMRESLAGLPDALAASEWAAFRRAFADGEADARPV